MLGFYGQIIVETLSRICIIKSVCVLAVRLTRYQIGIVIISHLRGNQRYNFELMRLIPKQCQVRSRYSINVCSMNEFIQLRKNVTSGNPLIRMWVIKIK